MAVSLNGNTIVFRASPTEDPAASGHRELELWVDFFDGEAQVVGENIGEADTGASLRGRTSTRWHFDVESHPFARSRYDDPDEACQHYGVGRRLVEFMMASGTHPYFFVYRTYQDGTNHSAGPIPYGGVDIDGTVNDDDNTFGQTTDTPAGIFPMEVVLDGDVEFTTTEAGFRTLKFSLWDATITTYS